MSLLACGCPATQLSKTLPITVATLVPIIRMFAACNSPACLLFVAQTVYRIEVCCEVCRIVSEEQTHSDGDGEPNRHPKIRKRRRNRVHKLAHHRGNARTNQDSDGNLTQRERHCFQQKLQPDVRPSCSDRFAHADLLR